MRGNRALIHHIDGHVGSIPACAGEPTKNSGNDGAAKVYPRVCGGTEAGLMGTVDLIGLSPRVRGNRVNNLSDVAGGGSIPACAGEPAAWTLIQCNTSVYPRVCGGTLAFVRNTIRLYGLSPRVRGNPLAFQ